MTGSADDTQQQQRAYRELDDGPEAAADTAYLRRAFGIFTPRGHPSRQDQLVMAHVAAARLPIHPAGFLYLVAAGHAVPCRYAWAELTRHRGVSAALYRVGDLEDLRADSGIDWAAVQAVHQHEPSALADLPGSRSVTWAAAIRRGVAGLADRPVPCRPAQPQQACQPLDEDPELHVSIALVRHALELFIPAYDVAAMPTPPQVRERIARVIAAAKARRAAHPTPAMRWAVRS